MDKVRVCRVCLLTDVNMYNIHQYPLDTYFEAIVGVNPLSMLELPPFICGQCAYLVKKYSLFKEKCLKGQAELYGVLYRLGQITLEDVKKINRANLELDLTLKTLFSLDVTSNSYPDETCINISNFQVKCEPNTEESLDQLFNVKEEDTLDDFPPNLSSEDDEPLSLHKRKKEKKIKKEKKKKRKKELEEDADDKSGIIAELQNFEATDLSELPPEISAVVQPRRRGRPRKTDVIPKHSTIERKRRTKNTGGVEVDEVDLSEYVTVIQLSMEEQLEEISKRQQSSNYKNAPYQCKLCFKGFIDTRAWKHHLSKHDLNAGDIECPICKFRFKTKRTLQKHAANHEKKFACKACAYVSKTTTQAKQHQRWHKGVTYKCQYCDEVSTKWTSYLSHVRIKHPSEFICGICGYSFVSKLGLTMHKTMMHKDVVETDDTTEDNPYCAECDVKFTSMEAFKRHMVTSVKHITNDSFSNGCRVCGEAFGSPEQLRLHHRAAHARQRPRNYGKKPADAAWPAKCEHCSEDIPNAREYWTHFRRVHPDKSYPIQKNYICDICGKSFRGNAFLVYHKRTHFEERAYKCPLCPKAFFNRTNLQMHEKTHSDHRPYPCTVCFKAFKCKGALDRHFRSHTGVKPYSCEVCGKSFGQSNSRKLHVRTVHLKQPAPDTARNRLPRKIDHFIF